jgi:hypothetical protein
VKSALVLALVSACGAAPPIRPTRDPLARARELFLTQIAAARRGDDNALRETFSPESIVLTSDSLPAAALSSEQWLHAPVAQLASLSEIVIKANGNADAIWLVAQFAIVVSGERGKSTIVMRVSEVATATSGWRVVAAGVAEVRPASAWSEPRHSHIAGATPRGKIAWLVDHSRRLAAQIAGDVIVAGPTDAEPPSDSGSAQLIRWGMREVPLHGEVREVSTGGIEFLEARLANGTQLVFVAIPNRGTPEIVMAHVFSG